MTPQPAPAQLAQEVGPERLGFGGADIHAQHFATTVGIHRDCNDDGDRADAAIVAQLHVGRIDPKIRPVAFERAVRESPDPRIDLLT